MSNYRIQGSTTIQSAIPVERAELANMVEEHVASLPVGPPVVRVGKHETVTVRTGFQAGAAAAPKAVDGRRE